MILQNGVVVGGDGFGFAKRTDGTHHKIVQSGVTVIEDDVEIQSLTSVDRATVGETRVRRGAKIDSLVQIGHACVVGEDNIICSQTGLAGSSILEKDVLLAGQVGISGHLTIHEGAIVYAQSGIGGDVKAQARVFGVARVRRFGMAARHHGISEAARDSAHGPRIEEKDQLNETLTQDRTSAARLQERGVSEEAGCPPLAHSVGISGASFALSQAADSRHDRVFRIGAHSRRRSRWASTIATPARLPHW